MKRMHIFNPAAGSGNSPEVLKRGALSNEETYVTTCVGDAERVVYERCQVHPDTHFIIYGGDGTLNEAVNGVIRAGAGGEAMISVIPTGSGNDFVRSFPKDLDASVRCDAIRVNGRYAVNIVNLGFDCDTAWKMNNYKRRSLVSGSAAYVLALGDVLCRKLGDKWNVEFERADGSIGTLDGEFLLLLIANGRFYGGGFQAAPLASLDDGLLDVIAVRKVSRARFISMVGDYKKGLHLDPETSAPKPQFSDVMIYERCRRIKVEPVKRICADGEIFDGGVLEAEIVPDAFSYFAY